MTDKYMDANLIRINDPEGSSEKIEVVFQMWNERLLRGSTAHFLSSLHYSKYENWLSIANISLAITVLFFSASQKFVSADSAAAGAALEADQNTLFSAEIMAIALPYLSLGVVLLSAFQYISQFASKSSQHRQAAVEYANLRRKLERYWTKEKLHPEAIHSLARTYNQVAKYPPLISGRIWKKAEKIKAKEIAEINERYFSRCWQV